MVRHTFLWLLVAISGIAGALAARTFFGYQEPKFDYSQDLPEILVLVEQAYVDDVSMEGLMPGAFQGALESMDENASYLPPGADTLPMEEKVFQRFGLSISKINGYGYLMSVAEGSPAGVAGLRGGTYIRQIDGKSTRRMSVFEMRLRLLLAEEEITLDAVESGRADDRKVVLKPGDFSAPKLVHAQHEGNLHVIRVTDSYESLKADLTAILQEVKQQANARLLLDLRNNALGDVDQLRMWASLFLDKGSVAIWVDAKKQEEVVMNPLSGEFQTLPLYILVDRTTSRAAEAFSAAVRENGARIIGESTLGLPARYSTLPLENGGYVRMATHNLKLGSGKLVTGKGIEPHHKLEFPKEIDPEDRYLQDALEWVKQAPLEKAG